MPASSSTTRSNSQSYRRQALIWLMVALVLGIVTALVWMASQTPAIGAKIENAPVAMPQATVSELEQPLSIESLHELDTDIQPINFEDTVLDLRNYPDEFKDKSYLLANKGKWTVQVMNVAENDVIVSYLEGRKDRNKFAYFRYLDENKQLRYMLTYGLLSSPQEAVGASKLVDFGLPADVRVLSEEVNRYVGIIDNYERPQPVKDLSTKRTRSVKLKPTNREVPARRKAPVASTEDIKVNNAPNGENTTTTGNVTSDSSIQKSNNNSDTLIVDEERTLSTDSEATVPTTVKTEDKTAKVEPAVKKPPVVATPKPPSATNSEKNSDSSSKKTDKAANKTNTDPIKKLIEEKNN